VSTYAISYIVTNLGMSSTLTFSLVLGLNLCGLVLIPLGGFISDKIGRKKLLSFSMPASLLGTIALFPLLDTESVPLMFLAMLLSQGAQFISVGAMAAFFAEPFPTSVRYTGHASVYTINNLIAGSSAPFAAALLLSTTGTTWSIIAVVGTMFIIAFIALSRLPETRWDNFETNHGVDITTPATTAGAK
jgi:MFS family permease